MSLGQLFEDGLFPLPPPRQTSFLPDAAKDHVPRSLPPQQPLASNVSAGSKPPAQPPSYVYKKDNAELPALATIVWGSDMLSPELFTSVTLSATEESNMKLQARLMYEMTQNKILSERLDELQARIFELESSSSRLAAAKARIVTLEEQLLSQCRETEFWKAEAARARGVAAGASDPPAAPQSGADGSTQGRGDVRQHDRPPSITESSGDLDAAASSDLGTPSISATLAESNNGGTLGALPGASPNQYASRSPCSPAASPSEPDESHPHDESSHLAVNTSFSSNAETNEDRSAKSANLEHSSKKKKRMSLLPGDLKRVSTVGSALTSAAAKMAVKSANLLSESKTSLAEKSANGHLEAGPSGQRAAHQFLPISAGIPVGKCSYCDHMFWGGAKGDVVKCVQCGEKCHGDCADKMQPNCGTKETEDALTPKTRRPSKRSSSRESDGDIYGAALKEGGDIPFVVTACVNAVERLGLQEEGIYRIPGRKAEIDKLKFEFNCGIRTSFDGDDQWHDVNTIAGAMKLYFRELPEPLLTSKLYPEFVSAGANRRGEELKQAIVALVAQLPEVSRKTLAFLMRHLKRVAENGAANKMYENNLAMVFGATLCPEKYLGNIGQIGGLCTVVELMIRECDSIFPNT